MGIFLSSISILKGSDIVSLSSLNKDQKNIYIIGIDVDIQSTSVISDSHPCSNLIRKLSLASCPTAFIIFSHKDRLKEVTHKTARITFSIFDFTVLDAVKNNFKSGNIDYIAFADTYDPLLCEFGQIITPFCDASNLMSVAKHLLPYYSFKDFKDFLAVDTSKPNPLFTNKIQKAYIKDTFTQLLKSKSVKNLTLKDYFNFIEKYDKKIMQTSENPLLSSLKKEWNSSKESAYRYFKIHTKNRSQATLFEICLNVILEKKSIVSGAEEYRLIVMAPLIVVIQFKESALLTTTMLTYDKLIICYPFGSVRKLAHSLEKTGFKAHYQGLVPDAHETCYYNASSPLFSGEEIVGFFNSILHGTHTNNEHAYVDDTAKQDRLRYIDSNSGQLSEKSLNNYSLKVCAICKHPLEAFKAFSETESSVYCSVICLLRKLGEQEVTEQKVSLLLQENSILTEEEKLILRQFGALCYLRAAILLPCLTQEYGLIYQLQLSEILGLLEKIENQAQDSSTLWAKTVELGKHWGIKLLDLKLFLGVYKQIKQNYLQMLLKASLNESYTSLGAKQLIDFDDKGQCANLQKISFNNIKKALNISSATKDISLIFLYNELIEQINKKVELPLEAIKDLLSTTYEHKDLTSILQFIGYTENPFNGKCTSIEKTDLHCSSNENWNEQESAEDTVHSSSKDNFPSFESLRSSPDDSNFKTVQHTHRKKIHTIRSLFAGSKPYTISLFKARQYVTQELQEAQRKWSECKKTVEAARVKILFALADSLEGPECPVVLNEYSCPLIVCTNKNYDHSIREKLDLHHLFTRYVDTFLQSYGIAEYVDNLIQVSIPGEIKDDQGHKEIGFFQYSYIPNSWICIHRCFRRYDANLKGTYITTHLRKILYDYLEELTNCDEYASIIEHLKHLIADDK